MSQLRLVWSPQAVQALHRMCRQSLKDHQPTVELGLQGKWQEHQ